jgi:hypothetical protein
VYFVNAWSLLCISAFSPPSSYEILALCDNVDVCLSVYSASLTVATQGIEICFPGKR